MSKSLVSSHHCPAASADVRGRWYRALALLLASTLASAVKAQISDERVFAYAQANYPTLFAGTFQAGQFQQYSFRFYPATGNYLGIDSNGVIALLGPASGGKMLSVGPKSAFQKSIEAWETPVAASGVCLADASLRFGSLAPKEYDVCYVNQPPVFACNATAAELHTKDYMGFGAGFTYTASYSTPSACPANSKVVDLGGDLAGSWFTVTPTLINSGLDIKAVTHDGSRFGAAASSYIIHSTNGVNWVQAKTPSGIGSLQSIVYSTAGLVAVGNGATLLYSTDTLNWERMTAPTGVSAALNRVIHAGGRFVAVGASQTILTSTDGRTWTKQSAPAGNNPTGTLVDVTYKGSEYLIAGYEGTSGFLYRSSDAVTWTRESLPTGLLPSALATEGTRYVLAGSSGSQKVLATSIDAKSWAQSSISTLSDFNELTVFGTRILAVGGGGLYSSKDGGVSWVQIKSGADAAAAITNGRTAACSSSQCILMGDFGTVYSTYKY